MANFGGVCLGACGDALDSHKIVQPKFLLCQDLPPSDTTWRTLNASRLIVFLDLQKHIGQRSTQTNPTGARDECKFNAGSEGTASATRPAQVCSRPVLMCRGFILSLGNCP